MSSSSSSSSYSCVNREKSKIQNQNTNQSENEEEERELTLAEIADDPTHPNCINAQQTLAEPLCQLCIVSLMLREKAAGKKPSDGKNPYDALRHPFSNRIDAAAFGKYGAGLTM